MTLDSTLPPVAPPPFPAPAPTRGNAIWLLELIPLAFGAFLGWQIFYQQSVPGSEFGGLGLYLLAILISFSLGVTALVLLLTRRGRAAGLTIVAAAAIVVGTVGTFKLAGVLSATAPNIQIGYVPPVVAHSIGTTQVTLGGVTDFSGASDNGAACASMDDSTVIGSVETLNAGEFAGGTLRAALSMDGLGSGRISLWIDGADVPESERQPMWEGAATIRGATTGNVSGDADFANVAQEGVDAGKGPAPTGGRWPGALSGSLHWTCRP